MPRTEVSPSSLGELGSAATDELGANYKLCTGLRSLEADLFQERLELVLCHLHPGHMDLGGNGSAQTVVG